MRCVAAGILLFGALGAQLLPPSTMPVAAGDFKSKDAEMTREHVKEHAAREFNARYADLYYKNPIDGQYFALDTVNADEFNIIEESEEGWQLLREPLVGMTVRAQVAKGSGAVAFEPLVFAYE